MTDDTIPDEWLSGLFTRLPHNPPKQPPTKPANDEVDIVPDPGRRWPAATEEKN